MTWLAVMCPAWPALAKAAPGPRDNGQLRVVHAAAERGPQDVFVDGQRVVAALRYGADTGYRVLAAGPHTVAVAPAGEPAHGGANSVELILGAGTFYTLVLPPEPATPLVLPDESLAAFGGPARVRLVHAAVDVGAIDLTVAGGPALATTAALGTASDYADAPAGTAPLVLRRADQAAPLASIPDATLAGDYAYTFVLVGAAPPAGWAILPLVDAYPPLRQIGRVAAGSAAPARRVERYHSTAAAGRKHPWVRRTRG